MANEIILVVDADTKSQKVLEVSFKKAGYQVEITDTMRDAIQRVGLLSPDLIVADTRLPDGDGFTFLEQLRANPTLRDVPFIFLTEEDGLDKKMKGFELGAADYLTKPIYIKEVTSRVELLLQKRAKNALADADTERVEGDLAQITMIDLLQTIERELRSGTIELQRDDGYQASVYFREGNILDAVCGNLQGEEALYRLMLWPKGRFVINYHETIRRADHIEKDSTALLMEGMRRFDRWNEMVRTLPHLSRIFEADYRRLPQVMSDLPSEVGRVVRLFDGYRTLRHVIDESPVDDITTLRIIRKLLDDDILLDVTPADAELRQTAQRTNLAAWLSGKIKDEAGEAPGRAPEAAAGPRLYDTTDAASTNPGLPFSPGEREFEEGQVPDADAPGDVSQWRFHWDNERGEAVRTLREEPEVSEDAFELESLEDDLAQLDRRRQEEEARRIKAEREALEEQLREREEEAAALRSRGGDEGSPEPADADEPAPAEPAPSADSTGDQWKISELDLEPEASKPVPEPEPEPEPAPEPAAEEKEETPREITQELHRNKILEEIERRHQEEEEAARERTATPQAMPAQARAESMRAADTIDPLSGVEDMFPPDEASEADEVATAEIPRAGSTSAERRAAAIDEADEVAREARELAEATSKGEAEEAEPREDAAAEPDAQPLIPLGSDEDLAGEPEVSAEDLERMVEASSDQLPVVDEPVDEYSLEELDTSEPADDSAELDASASGEYDVDTSGEYEDEDEYYEDEDEYYEDEYYEDEDGEYYEDEYYEDEDGEYYEDEEDEEDEERPTLDRTARDRELVHAEYDLKGDGVDAVAEDEDELEEDEEPVPAMAAAVSTAPVEEEPVEEPAPALDAPVPPAEEDSGFNTNGLLAVAVVVVALLGMVYVVSNMDSSDPAEGKKPIATATNNTTTAANTVTNSAVTNNATATNAATDTVAAASNGAADAGADAALATLTPEEAGAEAAEIAGSVHREAAIVALTRRGVDVATIEDPINHVVPDEVATNDPPPEDPKDDGAKKDPEPKDTGTPKTDGGEKPPKDDAATLAKDLKAVERLLDAEKQGSALKKAKKLAAANPDSGKARGLLGRAQLYSNNDRAIRDMNKAMEMGYKSPRLVLDLATAYQITGKNGQAKQIYKFFLKSYPNHKQAGAIKAILKNQL